MPRYFFALWPDDKTRDKLSTLTESLPTKPGRKVAKQNLHITLVFLGSVDADVLQLMRSDAAEIRVPGFSIKIDTFDWWKKPKVAWLAPKETPEALLDLVTKIAALTRAHSINIDDRPYRPHMTVARKVSSKPQSTKFASIHWNINEFCLLESLTHSSGVEYKVLETWPLLSS